MILHLRDIVKRKTKSVIIANVNGVIELMVTVSVWERQVTMPLANHRLKAAREMRGFTQAQLAQRLGVRQSQIANWEGGAYEPKLNIIKQMSFVLEVTIDYLLGVVDEPKSYLTEHDLSSDEIELIRQLRHTEVPEAARFFLDLLRGKRPNAINDAPKTRIESGDQE